VHEASQAQKSPEGMMLERSVSDDVQRALDALPADFRTAVVLCDVDGLSYKEIAEVMDCPVGTVMSRLFRGRRLLQTSLEQFAVEQGYVKTAADAAPRRRRSTSPTTGRKRTVRELVRAPQRP
jgi:RNA polymerase sigma-70 factor (ECF subfamily)